MAMADNDVGVRGILSDAKASNYCLMVARVFGSVRSTSTSIIDEAVEWCVDKGAKVINLSLGTSYRSRNSERLMEAIEKDEEVLVVAAAGNAPDLRSLHSFFYPASFDGVISVGAVDPDLAVSSFSQRNSKVDICAPGRDVLSLAAKPETLLYDEYGDVIESRLLQSSVRPTVPITARVRNCYYGLNPCSDARNRICIMERGENTFTEKARNCFLGGGVAMIMFNNEPGSVVGTIGPDPPDIPALSVPGEMADRLLEASNLTITLSIGSYAKLSGTSMAAPHVSGAIAKIWAARPKCTKDQVRTAIFETALDLGESGRDDDYGEGMVQVVKAYDYLMSLPSPCGVAEDQSNDGDDEETNDKDEDGEKHNSSSASEAISDSKALPTDSPAAEPTAKSDTEREPTDSPTAEPPTRSVWNRFKPHSG
jgi:serine protease